MLIGVPAETMAGETRVAVTPETVKKLKAQGHTLRIQSGAGVAASVTDEAFQAAGADITDAAGAFGAEPRRQFRGVLAAAHQNVPEVERHGGMTDSHLARTGRRAGRTHDRGLLARCERLPRLLHRATPPGAVHAASVSSASIANPPPAFAAHNATAPSAPGRPWTENGAISNSGARARIAKVRIGRVVLSRSKSSKHCWENGPCTTRPGKPSVPIA